MKFIYNGIEYSIRFQHQTTGSNRHTYCRILILPERKVLVEDDAYCHTIDNFNRTIGRRLSLTRTLRSLPKDFRRVAWMCYLNRFTNVSTTTAK